MKVKKIKSAHKEILYILDNQFYKSKVLWEEEHVSDFGDETRYFVCGKSKKKTSCKTYIPYTCAIFPKEFVYLDLEK